MRLFSIIFLLFLGKVGMAQVTFSVELLSDTMQIGDVNTYRMKVAHSSDVTIRSIDLKPLGVDPLTKEKFYQDTSFTNNPEKMAQLEEYFRQQGFSREVMEIQNYGNWQPPGDVMILTGSEATWTTQNNGNQVLKENDLRFTFFEEGIHKVLPPIIEYEQNGNLRQATANELLIQVGSPLEQETKPIDSLTVQPLKEIIDEPIDWVQDVLIPVGLFLVGVGLLGLLFYYLNKRSKTPAPVIEKPKEYIPPSAIAFDKLQNLKEEKLWQKDQVKEYQSQLTYIIREYLENRFQINALENTTHQIGLDLKSLNLSESLRNDLQNILQVADLVKFAKAQPDANVHEQFLDKANEFVQTTKKNTAQIEAEKAAIEAAYQKAKELASQKK